ncbi:hypothetical protein K503DRAFT_611763 [Rhizopogon vinicolor AM-OR11-026]|uniref:Uncharacterized protein n=1 Tax=Rhizopogon vinicolor AM-OR11-026 TaxID=1314800 RepID=A0A1B7NGE8_9AGAM|nr:hypothetical protein K503DRAFT_611763 [Rhizopogon vinicolor AM-OR11-026]
MSLNMSVTTTYTFQYAPNSLTSDYGAIWDERRRILITSNKPTVSAPDSAPPFTQHPMTRSNARRPVKRSAANTTLPQHVPESPISYHPSTVPSMPQHVLNEPLRVSCAPVSNSSTSPVEQGCRNLPRESPIDIPVAVGTPVVKPLHRYRSLPDIPSPPPRSRVFPTSVSFKSFFRRLRSSVKSMPLTNICKGGRKLFRWRVKI